MFPGRAANDKVWLVHAISGPTSPVTVAQTRRFDPRKFGYLSSWKAVHALDYNLDRKGNEESRQKADRKLLPNNALYGADTGNIMLVHVHQWIHQSHILHYHNPKTNKTFKTIAIRTCHKTSLSDKGTLQTAAWIVTVCWDKHTMSEFPTSPAHIRRSFSPDKSRQQSTFTVS